MEKNLQMTGFFRASQFKQCGPSAQIKSYLFSKKNNNNRNLENKPRPSHPWIHVENTTIQNTENFVNSNSLKKNISIYSFLEFKRAQNLKLWFSKQTGMEMGGCIPKTLHSLENACCRRPLLCIKYLMGESIYNWAMSRPYRTIEL